MKTDEGTYWHRNRTTIPRMRFNVGTIRVSGYLSADPVLEPNLVAKQVQIKRNKTFLPEEIKKM